MASTRRFGLMVMSRLGDAGDHTAQPALSPPPPHLPSSTPREPPPPAEVRTQRQAGGRARRLPGLGRGAPSADEAAVVGGAAWRLPTAPARPPPDSPFAPPPPTPSCGRGHPAALAPVPSCPPKVQQRLEFVCRRSVGRSGSVLGVEWMLWSALCLQRGEEGVPSVLAVGRESRCVGGNGNWTTRPEARGEGDVVLRETRIPLPSGRRISIC